MASGKRVYDFPDATGAPTCINALHVAAIVLTDPLTVTLETALTSHHAVFASPREADAFFELWRKRVEDAK